MKRLFWILPQKDASGTHSAIIHEIFTGLKAKQLGGAGEDTYIEKRKQIDGCTTAQEAEQEAREFVKGYVGGTAHEGEKYEAWLSEDYPTLTDLVRRARAE